MRYVPITMVAAASAVAFAQVVSAADMPVKAPRYAPAPPAVYSWTGFYVGGNVGYSWGNADTDFNAAPVTVNIINNFPNSAVSIPGLVGPKSVKPEGVIGGGQIGYNWQFAPNWVAGVEADIQTANEKASNSFTDPFSFIVRGGAGSARWRGQR